MNERLHLAGFDWTLADPFDTQDKAHDGLPSEPGLYLWLQRSEPGPDTRPTRRVLYAGKSKNLRARLHGYSATKYAREDPVLRALFDRVLAPRLSDRDLRMVIEGRLAPGLTQMWIRDHVYFAWTTLPYEETARAELRVINECSPTFNPTGGGWTSYETTWHELHDLTLPITPARLGLSEP